MSYCLRHAWWVKIRRVKIRRVKINKFVCTTYIARRLVFSRRSKAIRTNGRTDGRTHFPIELRTCNLKDQNMSTAARTLFISTRLWILEIRRLFSLRPLTINVTEYCVLSKNWEHTIGSWILLVPLCYCELTTTCCNSAVGSRVGPWARQGDESHWRKTKQSQTKKVVIDHW